MRCLARALRRALLWIEGSEAQAIDVVKPPILRRMDELARQTEIVKMALHDLKERRDTPLLDLGQLHAYVDASTEAEHLRDDWFNTRSGWWSHLPAIEPILREAFVAAGEMMLADNLAVDTYWVRGGDSFEVFLLRSDRQLTILFVTPHPPIPTGAAAAKIRAPIDIKRFGPLPLALG